MKRLFFLIIPFLAGTIFTDIKLKKSINKEKQLAYKHLEIAKMFDQWIMRKQRGLNMTTFFKKNNYNTIAIYGMSYLGERLVDELRDTDVNILYAIDKDAKYLFSDIDLKTMDDPLPQVDVVIVTAIQYYEEIKNNLQGVINAPIIPIYDVIFEMEN